MAFVKMEVNNNIALVTIDRPEALNALNSDVLTEIYETFEKIDVDPDIYVVVLTGAGDRSFVAGADIGQMKDLSAIEGKAFGILGNKAFRAIESCSKPVIAAVNGFALGGGNELCMSCDIRLASENAVFGQPEVGLGITPGFGGTQRLPRLIGQGMAKEIIYTANNIKAGKAKEIGLVNEVYPKGEVVDAAMKLAEEIKKNAQIAVQQSKRAINAGIQCDIDTGILFEAEVFGLCFATEDQTIGMTAFVNKEKEKHFVNK